LGKKFLVWGGGAWLASTNWGVPRGPLKLVPPPPPPLVPRASGPTPKVKMGEDPFGLFVFCFPKGNSSPPPPPEKSTLPRKNTFPGGGKAKFFPPPGRSLHRFFFFFPGHEAPLVQKLCCFSTKGKWKRGITGPPPPRLWAFLNRPKETAPLISQGWSFKHFLMNPFFCFWEGGPLCKTKNPPPPPPPAPNFSQPEK